MISSRNQIWWMGLTSAIIVVLYCLPFQSTPYVAAAVFALLVPVQILFWRLGHGRKTKDFFFCFSLLVLTLFLKHYWAFFDILFYVQGILLSAVLRYRVFLATGASSCALEVLREHYYGTESPEEVAFRYLLFFAAGTVTYLLLWDEKRQKEGFRKELDELKYGIHQVEEPSLVSLSSADQTSRSLDAALALDDSLKRVLQLIQRIFKPAAAVLWQHLPETHQLRIRSAAGDEPLKQDEVVDLGDGPVGWAALNHKTFFQQDREEGVSYPIYRKRMVTRSLLVVPVLDGTRLEGVLSLGSPTLNHFSADAEISLQSFAAQVAEIIRLARVAKEREERAFEFQAFYHASKELSSIIDFEEIIRKLYSLCGEIVPSDLTVIAAPENTPDKYSVHQWSSKEEAPHVSINLPNDGRTWISWFLNSREEPLILSESQFRLQEMPLVAEDEDLSGLISFLAVPMRHQQKSIGTLLLGSKHKDAYYSHQEHVIYILCNQAAVSLENSDIIQKMEELAITDGLTGLYNHRFFQDAIQRELERAERQEQPLALLILDIDHFKGLNDSFGHPAGDSVLKKLATLLQANARKVDLLSRYGGEEFAALLPGINVKNARKTAERWRKIIQRTSFKWDAKSFAVTVSIGVATFPDDATAKMELIEKADRALYDAKEGGRNQVRYSGEK